MFTIEGKYNKAKVFADYNMVEQSAIEQIKTLCEQKGFEKSKICIMPDVHAGVGCTIGTTMTITNRVIPNLVGVDIGCGMYNIKLKDKKIDLNMIDKICNTIPSGRCVWDRCSVPFRIEDLHCFSELKHIDRLRNSLGTLGGGNHFIEINEDSEGCKYLVVHTGSRNLGKQVANYYQKRATEMCNFDLDYQNEKEEIIRRCKDWGLEKEIQKIISSLKREQETPPKDLCFLSGRELTLYLDDMDICQEFAMINRENIANIIIECCNLTPVEGFHTVHNYIDFSDRILRKGSVNAGKGKRILIPLNMRDGSIIAIGKGNPDWNFSAPHGAGRILSRTEAFRRLTLDEFSKSMEGIFTTSISKTTLDESPMAYKPMDYIMSKIGDTVDIVEVIKPIYNFKAH